MEQSAWIQVKERTQGRECNVLQMLIEAGASDPSLHAVSLHTDALPPHRMLLQAVKFHRVC
jgi:hypothetical protein